MGGGGGAPNLGGVNVGGPSSSPGGGLGGGSPGGGRDGSRDTDSLVLSPVTASSLSSSTFFSSLGDSSRSSVKISSFSGTIGPMLNIPEKPLLLCSGVLSGDGMVSGVPGVPGMLTLGVPWLLGLSCPLLSDVSTLLGAGGSGLGGAGLGGAGRLGAAGLAGGGAGRGGGALGLGGGRFGGAAVTGSEAVIVIALLGSFLQVKRPISLENILSALRLDAETFQFLSHAVIDLLSSSDNFVHVPN